MVVEHIPLLVKLKPNPTLYSGFLVYLGLKVLKTKYHLYLLHNKKIGIQHNTDFVIVRIVQLLKYILS